MEFGSNAKVPAKRILKALENLIVPGLLPACCDQFVVSKSVRAQVQTPQAPKCCTATSLSQVVMRDVRNGR